MLLSRFVVFLHESHILLCLILFLICFLFDGLINFEFEYENSVLGINK